MFFSKLRSKLLLKFVSADLNLKALTPWFRRDLQSGPLSICAKSRSRSSSKSADQASCGFLWLSHLCAINVSAHKQHFSPGFNRSVTMSTAAKDECHMDSHRLVWIDLEVTRDHLDLDLVLNIYIYI